MALKIEITDEKGVKTRYHKIRGFIYNGDVLTVRLISYVNQTIRDAEKDKTENNAQAIAYDKNLDAKRRELDELSKQVSPSGEGEDDVIARIKELSAEVNDLASNPNRPQYQSLFNNFYDEVELDIAYFEPLSLEAIYKKLAQETNRYKGAESI